MLDHAKTSQMRIGKMLDELLSTGFTVVLSKSPDLYSGNAGSGATQRKAAAPTLEGCVETLTGHRRTKVCLRDTCASQGRQQPLDCFGPDRDKEDGKASVCRACEAKRIGKLAKRKKEGTKPG